MVVDKLVVLRLYTEKSMVENRQGKNPAFSFRKSRFFPYTNLGRYFYHPKGERLFCKGADGEISTKKGMSVFGSYGGMRIPLQIRRRLRIFSMRFSGKRYFLGVFLMRGDRGAAFFSQKEKFFRYFLPLSKAALPCNQQESVATQRQ